MKALLPHFHTELVTWLVGERPLEVRALNTTLAAVEHDAPADVHEPHLTIVGCASEAQAVPDQPPDSAHIADGLQRLPLGCILAGISESHSEVAEPSALRRQPLPPWLHWQDELEEPNAIMGSGYSETRFEKPRFEVLLGALLAMEADRAVHRILPSTQASSHLEILFGLVHPLSGSRLHKSSSHGTGLPE
jgi:hypothetical protein